MTKPEKKEKKRKVGFLIIEVYTSTWPFIRNCQTKTIATKMYSLFFFFFYFTSPSEKHDHNGCTRFVLMLMYILASVRLLEWKLIHKQCLQWTTNAAVLISFVRWMNSWFICEIFSDLLMLTCRIYTPHLSLFPFTWQCQKCHELSHTVLSPSLASAFYSPFPSVDP